MKSHSDISLDSNVASRADEIARESIAKKVVLLPHQDELRKSAIANQMQFPFYLIWQMGSGKTWGALACTYALRHVASNLPSVLVLCPLSLVGQWHMQIKRFFENADNPPHVKIVVAHYEQLDRSEVKPKKFHMCIVDEAARFRNAFKNEEDDEGRRPDVLHYQISLILECPRIVYLSGTPIIAHAQLERKAFDMMMKSAKLPLNQRISIYDPRKDKQFMRRFARREDNVVHVPMLWSQTLLYFMYKRRPFRLKTPFGELRSEKETHNSFESQLVKIANNPFTRPKFDHDDPEVSPKIMALVYRVEEQMNSDRKQVVYSSRKGEGVEQIRMVLVARELSRTFQQPIDWNDVFKTRSKTSPLPTKIANAARKLLHEKYLILSGDQDGEERYRIVSEFNRRSGAHRNTRVLCFTKAAGFGVDLCEVGDVHLLEVNSVRGEEEQVVARGLRLYGHRKGSRALVKVWKYIATFPDLTNEIDENWEDIVDSMRGVPDNASPEFYTKARAALFEQYILPGDGEDSCSNLSGTKTRCTIDQKHERDAEVKHKAVLDAVGFLHQYDTRKTVNSDACWASRARELTRDIRIKEAQARDVTQRMDTPSGHGWRGGSCNGRAVAYMKADWWPQYKFEEFPGMYDLAWRRVISRYPQSMPALNTREADAVRQEVKQELKSCRDKAHDVLSTTAFAKQVVGECKASDIPAFKRALLAQGYIKAVAKGGWQWSNCEQTFKIIPLPGQSGHEELLRRYNAELAVAPAKKK